MKLLFTDWLNKIDEHFEKEFWIDQTNSSEYVNRKQIYKDTVNSSFGWTDFQLRPNFLIAAVVVSSLIENNRIFSLFTGS
jgi:glycogen debranching enzyme